MGNDGWKENSSTTRGGGHWMELDSEDDNGGVIGGGQANSKAKMNSGANANLIEDTNSKDRSEK